MKKRNNVLAVGEATGHAHTIDGEVTREEDGIKYFKATEVSHQEHDTVIVPDIDMASGIVQEWDSFREEANSVKD